MAWIAAAALGLALAWWQYRPRRGDGRALLAAVALRALAATLVGALALDAALGRVPAGRPLVALDASASWLVADPSGGAWRAARDSARASGVAVVRFGTELRADAADTLPADSASRLEPVADRAAAEGRPVIVVTDGVLDDPEAVARLPQGSRLVVLPTPGARDAAIAGVEGPTVAAAGDTLRLRVRVVAGALGSAGGRLTLRREGTSRPLADSALAPLAPWGERVLTLRTVVPDTPALSLVVEVASPGDAVPRNDRWLLPIAVRRTPAAVFVTTAPDQDARRALALLRGTLDLPVRGYAEVSAGDWRDATGFARVPEAEVRRAVREAQVVVLHGDTARFGPPRAAGRGALVLFAPPAPGGDEFYAAEAGDSPLLGAVAALPFDSLPPLEVAARAPSGRWTALVARRARRGETRPVLVGDDSPRRVLVVAATGFWRWQARGGRAAEAYATLFGAAFDWVVAGEDRVVATAAGARGGAGPEWIPRRPTVRTGPVGGEGVRPPRRRATTAWWVAALAVLALAGEWLLRRAAGLR